MSEAARYRQKARAYEQRENWKRAIEAYERAIQEDKRARRDTDLSLFNRVGDLYRRVGDVNKSVQYWEAAADGHISAGFYNNAIALCNKVLRNQPNRHSIYLKLGKISAAKGFLSDARKHFLEYAERMQKANQLDAAFAALIGFADISPDPDIRILIGEQLLDHQRKDSAVEQLRLGWRDLNAEGREADAEKVRQRIIQLAPNRDPQVDPPEEGQVSTTDDAIGVVELPELEPLPFVDPEGAPAQASPPPPEPVAMDAATLFDTGGESAIEEPEPAADESLEVVPTSLSDEEGEVPSEESPEEPLEIMPTSLDEQKPESELVEEPTADTGANDAFLSELDPTDGPEVLEMQESSEMLAEPVITDPVEPVVDVVSELRGRIEEEGRSPELLVELADSLLEVGEREEATDLLREALRRHEEHGEFNEASRVISELLQLDINDLAAHQKRVEYALRAKDASTLIESYLDLADCLDRTEAGNKARAVYARVLELDPDNRRALSALELVGDGEPPEMPAAAAAAPSAADPSARSAGDFVDLGSLISDEKQKRSTRFTVPAAEPQSETEVNFADMLNQFKSKVAEAIEEEDMASHYDLGVAYKEMGLLDEAIAEFQIAARGLDYRLRAIEMLGACFLEKQDYPIALKVLHRALQVAEYKDEELVGIFYAMGLAYEAVGDSALALEWFERVLGCDLNFADVAQRVSALRQ